MENTGRRDRLAGIVLLVAAVIIPTLGLYAPLALAPLLIVVGLTMLALHGRRYFALLRPLRPLLALLLALGAWGMLSAAWSVVPSHSVIEALRFLGISFVGSVTFVAMLALPARERRLVNGGLLAGMLIGLALFMIERVAWAPIMTLIHPLAGAAANDMALVFYRFDRGVVVLVLMTWVVLFAGGPLWLRLTIFVVTVAMAARWITETPTLALGSSIVVFGIARFFPRSVAVLIVAGLLATSVVVPLETPSYTQVAALHADMPALKWSGIHRLLIWRFASDRVAERPLLGWGMDASRAIPGGDTDLTTKLPPGHYPAQALALPLHPHNGVLQLLLELGIPGLLLGLASMTWIIWHVAWRASLSPAGRAGALALITTGITIGLLSYGIWQEWWQSTLWLAASLFAATGAPQAAKAPSAGETFAARAAPLSQA